MMTQFEVANPATPSPALLAAVLAIAHQAGAAIMRIYAGEITVDLKQDDSPLTLADREAHRIITAGLQTLTPHIPVLSEESPPEHHAFATRGQWPTLWLVDPLDGTREFIKRNGEFTVNIALIHQHRPTLGVVTVPAADLAYTGAAGLGAARIESSQLESLQPPQPIRTRAAASKPVVVGSRSHRGDSLDALLSKLGPHELQSVGSALKFCRVAEGAADFYPRLGPTSEWDTAAGQAVLEAAGGQVLNLQGQPLSYNRRETLLNPEFMAVGDPRFAWQHLIQPAEYSRVE
ncbi:MAG: 3'(2'),5'-bisphosphate nucleotidase CysQ [Steroidobacteraceae bacterium]